MAGVTRGELGSAEKRTRVQTLSSFAAMINPSCKGEGLGGPAHSSSVFNTPGLLSEDPTPVTRTIVTWMLLKP